MNRAKFKSLVHYICWRCSGDPSKLGSVKLNKALWLSDLTAYRASGDSITGARYIRQQFGPVPALIVPVLRELEQEGILTVRETSFYGRTKKEYIVHVKASGGFLDQAERQIVDETIQFVCEEHTAVSISNKSHDHIWEAAVNGEEIPHYTVFAQPAPITNEDREWAHLQLENAI